MTSATVGAVVVTVAERRPPSSSAISPTVSLAVIVTFLVVLTIRSRFRRAPVQSVEEDLLDDDGTIRAVHVFAEPPARPVKHAGTRRAT